MSNEPNEQEFSTATTGEKLDYFNGYHNYPTWVVGNHYQNTEWLCTEADRVAARALRRGGGRAGTIRMLRPWFKLVVLADIMPEDWDEVRDWGKAFGHNLRWAKAQIDFDELATDLLNGLAERVTEQEGA